VAAIRIALRLEARAALRTAGATIAARLGTLDIGALGRLGLRRAAALEAAATAIAAITACLAATAAVATTAIAPIAAILVPAAMLLVLRHGRHGSNRCQQKRTYHPTHPAILFFHRRDTLRLHDGFCALFRLTSR